MINHARTLLLNMKDGDLADPGEEYISPHFRSIQSLPRYITEIRRILFGSSPDRRFSNFRARQYMPMLHSTELIEFVRQLDTRITYDIGNSDLFDVNLWGIHHDYDDLVVLGDLPAPDATGKTYHRWAITILDADTSQVVRWAPAPSSDDFVDFTTTNELSSEILLSGSDVRVRVHPTVGKSWVLQGYSRPAASLGSIVVSLESAAASSLSQLFGDGTVIGQTEPFLTFRNLWYGHYELPYRLGGLLTALILRMDAIGRGDGQ